MKIELVPYNPANPEHTLFLFQTVKGDAGTLLDDSRTGGKDPVIAYLAEIDQQVNTIVPQHFIVVFDGEMVGFIGCLVDQDDNAFIEAIMPTSKRFFWTARAALLAFCERCFREMGVQKIKANIPVFNRNAEAVARSVGFRKEGIAKRERSFGNKRRDVIMLAVFPWQLRRWHSGKAVLQSRYKGTRNEK